MFGKERSGQIAWDTLIPWLIGIGVLALMIVTYMFISDRGQQELKYLMSLLRFGR